MSNTQTFLEERFFDPPYPETQTTWNHKKNQQQQGQQEKRKKTIDIKTIKEEP